METVYHDDILLGADKWIDNQYQPLLGGLSP